MQMKGVVIASRIDERDFVNKDGSKRHARVSRVTLNCTIDGVTNILNIRAYDVMWELPAVGKTWTMPSPIRKAESNDGIIYEVVI